MAVPSWTKEWRPLVRELCAHTRSSLRLSTDDAVDGASIDACGAASNAGVRAGDEREAMQRMDDALAVDRVVAQLYAHRFLEVHRKQVADEIEAIAVKLHVHSLGERGERLRELAARVVDEHYQVLKLLIELAESPTTASDVAVVLDPDANMLTQQQEQQRVIDREQELHEQLAEELFEISTNDEWYQQWDDSDDDDGADSSDDDASDTITGVVSAYDVNARSLRIGRKQLEPAAAPESAVDAGTLSDDDDPMADDATLPQGDDSGDDEDSEDAQIRDRDALLLRYYPKTALSTSARRHSSSSAAARKTTAQPHDSDEHMTSHDLSEPVAIDSSRDKSADATAQLLSLETPSLLYAALTPQFQRPDAQSPRHRIVHERTLVACVFQAFAGVDSFVFDVASSRATSDLAAVMDRDCAPVQLSPSARGVAVAHLSPSALHHFLDHFARAASDLQLLRDVIAFIARDTLSAQHPRCCTLEGLAQALATVVRACDRAIWRAEQQALAHCRQPTLLALVRDLKPHCTKIAWLKRVVSTCVHGLGRQDDASGAAACAKHVLDALYAQLEVEYVQSIHTSQGSTSIQLERADSDTSSAYNDSDDSALFMSSRYAILLHLFVCALTPYLDLLQTLLFERGHSDVVALHSELFFVTPAAMKRIAQAPMAPSSSDTRTDPSFHDALRALAPFEVDVSRVPVFLAPAIESLNEAVASRQMTNRYVQQQRDAPTDGTSSLSALLPLRRYRKLSTGTTSHATLSELFLDDLARAGVYSDRSREATMRRQSVNTITTTTAPTAAQLSVQNMPFGRTIKQCLLQHVEHKCRELNGAMASLFRQRLQFLEHVDALRSFVLMQQQDVFAMLSEHLLEQMQTNPITWADGESINRFFHSTLHRLDDEHMIAPAARDISARICVRINATQLKALGLARKIDIAALKCLYFTFSTPQPLRVLFSASVLRKYSRLATFLLQVKAVASAIIKFKRHVRHKRCFPLVERDLRSVLVQMSDMLHYTTSLLNYLASQVANATWDNVRRGLETVESIAAMDHAHEQYLDQLLNKFFLLEKHTTVIQYILTTFNHIMRFVSHVDELVNRLERTASDIARASAQAAAASTGTTRSVSIGSTQQQSWDLRYYEHTLLHDEIAKSASEFKRQSHFLVVMLTAMHKHGASPHVAEILTQLNFNDFYHQTQQHSPRRSRS